MKTITKSTFFGLSVITLVLAALQVVFASPPPESPNDVETAMKLEPGEYKQFGLLAPPLATVYSSCKNNKQVALTFDDGPWVYACVVFPSFQASFLSFLLGVSRPHCATGGGGTIFANALVITVCR